MSFLVFNITVVITSHLQHFIYPEISTVQKIQRWNLAKLQVNVC